MKWMPVAMLALLALAASLRLPRLAERPMHHDEANQAYRFGILLERGTYHYDANDHHGPTLYYLTLPSAWLAGARNFAQTNEATYRIVPVCFGLLLILCTPLLRNGTGRLAAAAAALFAAISPAMAYYSRFYIQETLLLFFTFLAIAAGWRSVRTGSRGWALAAGLAAGLMFATKETAVLAYAAMAGAVLACMAAGRARHLPLRNMALAGGAALAVAYLLFSSFLTHPGGPLDAILAFKGYLSRGSGLGTVHVHPWYFYLEMLVRYRFDGGPVWSEGLAFGLGIAGCAAIATRNLPRGCDSGFAGFLMAYTLLLTAIYSAIPYKTPWCLLSFLHGWILLAGIGAAALLEGCWNATPKRGLARTATTAALVLLLMPVAGTLRLAQRTVSTYAADYRNPYAYAQTVPDFMRLVRRVGELAAADAKGIEIHIQVIAAPDQTWPLPFYLRRYPNVGYWAEGEGVPKWPRPGLIISAADPAADEEGFVTEYYGLRPDTLLALHIPRPLWEAFLATRAQPTPDCR